MKNKTMSFPRVTSASVGSFLIYLSLAFFVVLYGPFLLLFLPQTPSEQTQLAPDQFSINIPKISASAPIINQVDPWNETEYRRQLKLGVAHASGSSLPGEEGTTYLFAHSSDLPWNLTRYNIAFFRLKELERGDSIFIYQGSQELKYQVSSTKVVWPDQVQYLTQNQDKNQLILQTCTPIGTSLKRLLVFADPIS